MDMQQLLAAVGMYGFPMVVCCYLLCRVERVLGELRDGVRELIVIQRNGGGK